MPSQLAAAARSPLSDLLRDPRRYRSDLRLLRRAIREGWPVGPEVRHEMMRRLGDLLTKETEGLGERGLLNAVECAIAASWPNS